MSGSNLIVVLVGPGGVGKGTLAAELVRRDPRLWLSRSWTTRAQRPSETGDEYTFVTREQFEEAATKGRFLEWAEFHGNLYGTPKPSDLDNHDLLLEIEVQGASQVKDNAPDAVVILVMPPSMEELERRLRSRGDSEDHVQIRLSSTPHELARGRELATFTVVNDDPHRAVEEILAKLEGLRRGSRDHERDAHD